MRARHGVEKQARRTVIKPLQAQQRAQLPEMIDAQDYNRLADGVNLAGQVVVAGIDTTQHVIGHGHVLADQQFNLVDRILFV